MVLDESAHFADRLFRFPFFSNIRDFQKSQSLSFQTLSMYSSRRQKLQMPVVQSTVNDRGGKKGTLSKRTRRVEKEGEEKEKKTGSRTCREKERERENVQRVPINKRRLNRQLPE